MNKYLLTGKIRQGFATAMLNKLQNRKHFVKPFLQSLDICLSPLITLDL
ncbi:MAG: hypothetical protein P8M50_01215 [Paracoccaceae bacterium]|nr:hypothetical protein [Paracoccaceae bacterium]